MKIEYFLGIGQNKKASRWLSRLLPAINFHVAPDYLSVNSDEDRVAIGLSSFAGVRADGRVLIAESQAASAAIAALSQGVIGLPNHLILIQPLGLNYDALGSTRSGRRRELLRRSRLFWKHQNQSLRIAGNRWTAMNLITDVVRHPFVIRSALEFGANQNYSQELVLLAKKIKITIVATDEDSLFPYEEIKKLNPEVDVLKMSGTHLNRATVKGVEQLRLILSTLDIHAESSRPAIAGE